jgi:hypothetical protein
MGVVIEICIKYPGGPTRMRVADITATPERALFSRLGMAVINV